MCHNNYQDKFMPKLNFGFNQLSDRIPRDPTLLVENYVTCPKVPLQSHHTILYLIIMQSEPDQFGKRICNSVIRLTSPYPLNLVSIAMLSKKTLGIDPSSSSFQVKLAIDNLVSIM